MLDGTHDSAVFPHHQVFMSYTKTPRLSHHIQRLAKLDKNGRAGVADHTSHDNIRYDTGEIPTIKNVKFLHDKELQLI
jgi:hypothetical protein